MVLLSSFIYLLIFSLVVLALTERVVVKFPTITIDLLVSPFSFVSYISTYFASCSKPLLSLSPVGMVLRYGEDEVFYNLMIKSVF